jgi:hypothetical protein
VEWLKVKALLKAPVPQKKKKKKKKEKKVFYLTQQRVIF